jgi:hypothetical protein
VRCAFVASDQVAAFESDHEPIEPHRSTRARETISAIVSPSPSFGEAEHFDRLVERGTA